VAAAGIAAVDRIAPRRHGDLTVLTYHRVDEPDARPDLMPSLLSATPAAFADQMALVARHYEPVAMTDILAALERPALLPRRAVLVTFDDGYLDFAEHAWPILRAAAIPVTLFVATSRSADPTRPFWWDRLWAAMTGTTRSEGLDTPIGALPVGDPAAVSTSLATIRTWLKGLDHDAAMAEVDTLVAALDAPPATVLGPAMLGWGELRRLAGEGVTLAPHTREHPLLDRVPIERAVAEIEGSRLDLEREIGAVAAIPAALAYPSGAHGGDAVEAARQAGMRLAFTTDRGGNDLRRADPLRLRRINVGRRASAALVRAQLVWASTVDARRAPRR
jgi:peptidoglycan/xylan/chitin deacetylase (PgdA/CDA1 family)